MTNNEENRNPAQQDWQNMPPEPNKPGAGPHEPKDTPPLDQPGQPQNLPPGAQQIWVKAPAVKPIVTYLIFGATILVFLAQNLVKFQFKADFVLAFLAKVNSAIISGELWRFFTPVLVHGGIIHIGFNMYALWILGRQVEMLFGHGRFTMLYLVGAFGGNVLSFAFSPAASVGASTAIFGLIGAHAVFIFKNRKIFGERTRGMLTQIAFILLLNFTISIVPNSAIDLWGHLGGFLAGTVYAVLGAPVLDVKRKDGRFTLEDTTAKSDGYLAFLMVILAFSVIAFFVIRNARAL